MEMGYSRLLSRFQRVIHPILANRLLLDMRKPDLEPTRCSTELKFGQDTPDDGAEGQAADSYDRVV